MKKYLFICSALALLALVSSCQKEQRTVTLGVSLEQDAKLVIDGKNYPCWSSGDLVHVNGQHDLAVSDISPNGHSAQITGVTESTNGYCVLFPSSLVSSGTTISSGEVSVVMPSNQEYAEDANGRQKVTLPMGGVSSSTNMTLHNLGSILRVNVTNGLTEPVTIKQIMVTADNDFLSGNCTATISSTAGYRIVANSTGGDHTMKLIIPSDAAAATIVACSTSVFSIVLPTFSTGSRITVRIWNTDNKYQEFQTNSTDITLDSNQIVNFNATLNSFTSYEDADLKEGVQIKTAIQNAIAANSNITAVSFVCGAIDVTSGTELQEGYSPTKIYGNVNGNTYVISTPASVMEARNCSSMFQNLSTLTSITFGEGFSTVGSSTNEMNNMFSGCSGLTSLDLSSFNTENVCYMGSMFSGCTHIFSLNLSNFVINKTCDLYKMCSGLASQSPSYTDGTSCYYLHYCTITCSSDVQSKLQDLNKETGLPSEWTGVHFNWVTPSSK